jgi:NADH-quinone oxidoreductase subunit H
MPQIDTTIFFFEIFWFFLFFIILTMSLLHFVLVPSGEAIFLQRQLKLASEFKLLLCGALLHRPMFGFSYNFFFIFPKTGVESKMFNFSTPATLNGFGLALSLEMLSITEIFTPVLYFFESALYWIKFIWWVLPLFDLLSLVLILVGVLLSVAFYTLVERKVMASSQRRKGPDLVGFWGVLQAVADGLKLVIKENLVPTRAHSVLFVVAAMLPFVIAFSSWVFLPLSSSPVSDLNAGLPMLLAFSSLGVYGVIFSGWASNSKYAFLGGLRSAAQVISYELVLGFSYLCVALLAHSLDLVSIIYAQESVWFILPLFPVAGIYLIAMLAETNRTPFDLPEAEAELVAGYNVEYSGLLFAFFFLGEYASMLFMSAGFSVLFLGGWLPIFLFNFVVLPGWLAFILKTLLVALFFVFARAALPRVRYDQLMLFSWKILLPFEFGLFFLYSGLVYFLAI